MREALSTRRSWTAGHNSSTSGKFKYNQWRRGFYADFLYSLYLMGLKETYIVGKASRQPFPC